MSENNALENKLLLEIALTDAEDLVLALKSLKACSDPPTENNTLVGAERPLIERIGHFESFFIAFCGYEPEHGDPHKHGQECRKKLFNEIRVLINLNLSPSPKIGQVDCE